MSNQEHPPSEPSKFSAIQRHPVRTAIIAILVFVAWTLPLSIAQSWSAFVRDKTIPEWLAERRWPGMTTQLYGWLTIVFFLVLVILLVAIIIISRRREISSSLPKSAPTEDLSAEHTKAVEDLKAEHERTVEKLNNRIQELERENTDLRYLKNSLEFKYRWLFSKAEAQEQEVSNYVKVEKVYFCYHELQTPMLKSVFGIDFINKSVFDISIDTKVGGHIEFEEIQLTEPPLIISSPGIIGLGIEGKITLEQRLTRSEADFIASKDPKFAAYNLENLIITIKGERLSNDKPQHLDIPKRLYIDPQLEIDSLKFEIAAQTKSHAKKIKKLEEDRRFVESQLWQRMRIARALNEMVGYGNAIEHRCQAEGLTYPKPVIDVWAKRLWETLFGCFEENDIERFYSGIDPRCPGYERGPVRVIKVPESNEDRQLWLYYHHKRLLELINEQFDRKTIAHKEEG